MVKRIKLIIIPFIILVMSMLGLFFSENNKATATAETPQTSIVNYSADFSNGRPYDWMRYGYSDIANTGAERTENGSLILSSNGGSYDKYYGSVYQFATGLGNVSDFTIEFKYRVLSSTDDNRWVGLMYHTKADNLKRISGYSMVMRKTGSTHQTTVYNDGTTINYTDSTANTSLTQDFNWNDYHTLIVKAEGNVISHYVDSLDNLMMSYDITDNAYSTALSPQTEGSFALIVNYCTIEIKSVNITATRDTSFNTKGLKSGVAISSSVNSLEDCTALTTNGATSAVFHLTGFNQNDQVAISDENKNNIDGITLADIGAQVLLNQNAGTYPKFNSVYPIIYIDTELDKQILVNYLSQSFTYENQDPNYNGTTFNLYMAIMSDNKDLLKSARQSLPYERGMLDWSKQSIVNKADFQRVVSETASSNATVAVLSQRDATFESVNYIQSRGITVWVKQTTFSTHDTADIIATGAMGIITSNVSSTTSALALYENDVNGLSRAPLNIAHRGMSFGYYTNTLEGCKASIATGATHVEIDAYVTTDNRVVIMHDDPLYIATNCTDTTKLVSNMTLEEIKQYKVTKESNEYLMATVGEGVEIPTLDDMFTWAKQDPNVLFYLELKPNDAKSTEYNTRLVNAVSSIITQFDIKDQLLFITSTNDLAVKARTAMPDIPILFTGGSKVVADYCYSMRSWAYYNYGVDSNNASVDTENVVALGYMPAYWTYEVVHRVNAELPNITIYNGAYETAISNGLSGITNNYPYLFKNNAERLFLSSEEVSVDSLDALLSNGYTLNYQTYGGETKTTNGTVFTSTEKNGETFVTFKATFTNEFGLTYTMYTEEYKVTLPVVNPPDSDGDNGSGNNDNGGSSETTTPPTQTTPTTSGGCFGSLENKSCLFIFIPVITFAVGLTILKKRKN